MRKTPHPLFAASYWLILTLITPLHAEERQAHGLYFEKWVRNTFYDHYHPSHMTQKWDIPAEANPLRGNIPVSIKSSKLLSQIDLGDALRQFDIANQNQPFQLIIGFWQPTKKRSAKHWLHAISPIITPTQYQHVWHPITRTHLEQLNTIIKDRNLSLSEARQRAHHLKSQPPFNQSIIKVNPKLDANQRRLQCSISYHNLFQHLAPNENPHPPTTATLFNTPLPKTFSASSPH